MKHLAWLLPLVWLLPAGCHRQPQAEDRAVSVLSENRLAVSPAALKHLKIEKCEKVDFPEYLTLMGRISPTEDRTTTVPARVAGRIEAVYVASGETVHVGQVLARLFSPDFISAREEYLQSLKQEKESKGDASFHGLARMARKKLETMGLAQADIDALSGSASSDDAGTAARAAAAPGMASSLTAKVGGGDPSLVVRAPRAGAIATKNATVGNLVNVGDTLFTLADLSKVWFLGDLYPEDLPKVRKDQDIYIQAMPGEPPLHGVVSFISPFVDPAVRSIKIRAAIDNPNTALRADMYVQGNLLVRKTQSIVVPTAAIVRSEDSDYVFKKTGMATDESVQVEKVKVKVGNQNQGMIAVIEGIQPGEEIVTQGALVLEGAFGALD